MNGMLCSLKLGFARIVAPLLLLPALGIVSRAAFGGDPAEPLPLPVEATPEKPLVGNRPLEIAIKPGAGLIDQIKAVASGQGGDREIRLTLQEITPPKTRDLGIRIFVNTTDADRKTPIDDAGYVTSVTFGQSDGGAPRPESFVVNLGPTLRRLQAADRLPADRPLRVTLVAVPLNPRTAIDDREMSIKKVILDVNPGKDD